jgi:hypothetical protein
VRYLVAPSRLGPDADALNAWIGACPATSRWGCFLVIGVDTLAVVTEHLNHPAVRDPTVITGINHGHQLSLQGRQTPDHPFNIGESGSCERIRICAGLIRLCLQGEQRPDGIQPETQVPGMPDKPEPADILWVKAPSVAFGSRRGG